MANNSSWLPFLILWNLLNETENHEPLKGFKYASYEVTIPRKLMPKHGQDETTEVTYHWRIEGKGYIVNLRQKRSFVPKNFPVLTYTKHGDFQVDYPFIRRDCFYQGYVEGNIPSQVTLSACSGGFRGLFQFDNKTYETEPVQASPTFEHVVFRLEEKENAVRMKCGLTEEMQKHHETMMQNTEDGQKEKEGVVGMNYGLTAENQRQLEIMMQNIENGVAKSASWWSHTRYVKAAIVVEHERYVQFDRNETLVALQVLDIFHVANSLYEPLSVQLSIAGLEIWSERNLIQISNNMGKILDAFQGWRKDSLNKRLENDVAHLFVYKHFGTVLGLAFLGTICNRNWASAVVSYTSPRLLFISNTFAHELGHNLGMRHDDKYCYCEQSDCIMAAYYTSNDKFSNCSYSDYFRVRNYDCLLIPPDLDNIYKLGYCGNKVVENGEQCDCGSEAQCELDPCCQSNCMFRARATCAFGKCCSKCQYLPAQSLCRKETGICDLPEYCNGTSELCPKDVHVQDGASCADGAYCYLGNCTTNNIQCKMIFGKKAVTASKSCFRNINAQGDRFGNCGLKHGMYRKCTPEHSQCGRILCENIHQLPFLEEHNTLIQMVVGDKECWSTDYHSGMERLDTGAVRDGTPCGPDMMCIDGKCVSVSLLKYDCNVTKCHNRGICNSLKNCHCDYGWAPPECLNDGHGGSIDSGPPPWKVHVNIAGSAAGGVLLISLIAVTACLALLLGLNYLFRRWRARQKPTESPQLDTPQTSESLLHIRKIM
ncbi:disintegrin and metalloproteinase domain-containing protein 20-like [Anolis sagrei]|uniref:disintegrin and metalloproteinase domain-containing protein 20-like n=1 Tax=Anolis sagrei TaxID=38937 RepID=UPI0035214B9A